MKDLKLTSKQNDSLLLGGSAGDGRVQAQLADPEELLEWLHGDPLHTAAWFADYSSNVHTLMLSMDLNWLTTIISVPAETVYHLMADLGLPALT